MARTLDDILDLLGGDLAVARFARCSPAAVSNWKARGIPPARRIMLFQRARALGIQPPVTLEELQELSAEISRQTEPCA